jgi:hypothetical protein
MRSTVIHAARDIRLEDRPEPAACQPVHITSESARMLGIMASCGSSGVAMRVPSAFWVGLRGGPAPVRAYLPELLDRVWNGHIEPGKVFDLTLPLDEVAEGYAAMDERRAIKTLLRP